MMNQPTFDTPLTQLERADLIRRAKESDEAYQFKHALVQDSAYASLLRTDRRNLHRECARALERTFANALDEYAALLSQHYAEAGDDAKTFEYARRAGDVALRVHAHTEAIAHYDTAVMLASRLPLTTDELVEIYQRRGRTLELTGRYLEAVESYRTLEQAGSARGDTRLELAALLPLITLYIFPNPAQDLEKAQRKNERALELARENHDERSEARILWNRQQHAYFTGQSKLAIAYSREALALADRLGLRELRGYILNDVSRAMMSAATIPAALAALDQARVIWRETNNLPMLVDNLSTTAGTAQMGGDLESAEQFALQAQELSRTIGNLWNIAYSNGPILQIAALRGEITKTLKMCEYAHELAKASGFWIAAHFADFERGRIYGEMGQVPRGIEILNATPANEAFLFFESFRLGIIAYLDTLGGDFDAARRASERAAQFLEEGDISTPGPIYTAICTAEIALYERRYGDALGITEKCIQGMRAVGVKFFLPYVLLRQARTQRGLGDADAADRTCLEAEELARSMRARLILWEILALRAELANAEGKMERAAQLRGEARDVIEWIAEHSPVDLRVSFRTRPAVRTLFAP